MRHERAGPERGEGLAATAAPCAGPAGRRGQGAPILALGASATLGRGVDVAWPALLAARLGRPAMVMARPGGGVDTMRTDAGALAPGRVRRLVAGAALRVVEVTGAQALSSRYYRVHPRRADRFVAPSEEMRAAFPGTDFTEFHFTGHLLGALASRPAFAALRAELRAAWSARMRSLLEEIGAPSLLLWMGPHAPGDPSEGDWHADPAFITAEMLKDLSDLAPTVVALLGAPAGPTGLPGAAAHEAAATALARAAQPLLGERRAA